MWPWGHLAVGYLCYAIYTRYRYDEHPAGVPAVVLAVATQLPDLIDKPLAYTLGVLPEGRALAHSLLFAVPVCGLALWVAWRASGWRGRVGSAFTLGYATHLFGDSVWSLLGLDFVNLTFLAWPLLPAPDYDTKSFGPHLDQFMESIETLTLASPFLMEWVLFGLVVGLWLSHRAPPLPSIVGALRGQNDDIGG